MNSNGLGRHKLFTQIEHRARARWPRGFGALNSSPHSSIFTSVSVVSSPRSYLFTSVTGQSMAQNLSDMSRFTFKIGAAELRSVTKIAPKSPFLCENRSPIRYDFRAGAKTIWYRVTGLNNVPRLSVTSLVYLSSPCANRIV